MDKLFYLHQAYDKHAIRLLVAVKLPVLTPIFYCECGLFFIHHKAQPCWESAGHTEYSDKITAAIAKIKNPAISQQWKQYCAAVRPSVLAGEDSLSFWKNHGR